MKGRTTIYVNKKLIELAKATQLNISATCEQALEEATGFKDAETLATRILRLKGEIRLATDIMEDSNNIHNRSAEMAAMYEKRHPKGMKVGPSKDQDMTWIRAVKGRYGLQGMRDKELYKKLREGLA